MQEFEHNVRNALPGIYKERKAIVNDILHMCEYLDNSRLPNRVKLLLITRALRRQAASVSRLDKHLARTLRACLLQEKGEAQ
jgi:hypothetical protein